MEQKNESLSEKLQSAIEEKEKKTNYELEDAKRRINQIENFNGAFENTLKTCMVKANECARLVDEFNDSFLSYAKEEGFEK